MGFGLCAVSYVYPIFFLSLFSFPFVDSLYSVGVVDTALPLKITCSGSGKELSSTLNSIQSSKVSSFSFDPNAEFAITRILTDFDSFTIVPENTKLSLPTSRASTPKSSTAVSIGGSTTFSMS